MKGLDANNSVFERLPVIPPEDYDPARSTWEARPPSNLGRWSELRAGLMNWIDGRSLRRLGATFDSLTVEWRSPLSGRLSSSRVSRLRPPLFPGAVI